MKKFDKLNIERKKALTQALSSLCKHRNILPCTESVLWPSTRDIAEVCGLNIYETRYFLLKLAAECQIEATTKRIKKSLRWRIINY